MKYSSQFFSPGILDSNYVQPGTLAGSTSSPTKEKTLETKMLPDKKLKCYGICKQQNFITYAHDKEKKRKKEKHSGIEGIQLSHNLGCGEKSPSQIPAPNSHKSPQKSQIAQFRAISPRLGS